MNILRKQEVLPALPRPNLYETKSFSSSTWAVSPPETDNWRDRLRFLAEYMPERGKYVNNELSCLLAHRLTQDCSQGNGIFSENKSDQLSRKTEFSKISTETSVLPWAREEVEGSRGRLEEVHSSEGGSPKRNRVPEDNVATLPSKLPSFEMLNAISQKEETSSEQRRCFSSEAVKGAAALSSLQTLDWNSRIHDSNILHSLNSSVTSCQRNDSNSYKTSSSDENFYPIRQLPPSEFSRARSYDCVEPSPGIAISDEQKRFGFDNVHNMGASLPVYEEPHPLVTLRSTEGLTQEQKQLRRILKNRWSAKMSRMKRNEQIRRLELKSNKQEKIIRELLEERDSLKNEISLLKKQREMQQIEHVSGSSV